MNHRIFSTKQPIILASGSPRRQSILAKLGIEFTIITADIDETPKAAETPESFALRMASDKARAVAMENSSSWVVGADTVVTLPDGTILGKPGSPEEAFFMLSRLNNATHRVITGLCLFCHDRNAEFTEIATTEVTFMNNPDALLKAYVRSGEPLDKAGSYGIQGIGSFLIESINGSCTNVIGLPVNRLVTLLLRNNIITVRP